MGTQGMRVGKRATSKRCCAKTIAAPDLVVSVIERLNQTNLILACLMRAEGWRNTDMSLFAAHLFQTNSNFSHSFSTLI